MVELFRLAFFLTADAEKAEHCVTLAMQECMATDEQVPKLAATVAQECAHP